MFKAYMDETGIQAGDAYCTIAGYAGTREEWQSFEHDWNFILSEYMRDLPESMRYFHALDFYESDKQYRTWKRGKRESYISALFDVISDHKIMLYSSSVDSRVFFSLTEDERRYLTGGIHNGTKWKTHGAPTKPYFLPLQHCVIQATDFVPDGDKVFPIMSRQDQYKMKALELYDLMLESDPVLKCRNKLADDMVFSDPKKVPGLQAADLAAYWLGQLNSYRAKTGDYKDISFPHKVEMRRLLGNGRHVKDFKMFNFQGLMLLLQGTNRHTKSSFLTLDQMLPSIPAETMKLILCETRKVNFRRFLDQWQPTDRSHHG